MLAFYDNLSAGLLIAAVILVALAAALAWPRTNPSPAAAYGVALARLGLAVGLLGILVAFEP